LPGSWRRSAFCDIVAVVFVDVEVFRIEYSRMKAEQSSMGMDRCRNMVRKNERWSRIF
jgi:hypothetical protein